MFTKEAIIKAVTQVSIIVIALIVAALILNAVVEKKCNCAANEIADPELVSGATGAQK